MREGRHDIRGKRVVAQGVGREYEDVRSGIAADDAGASDARTPHRRRIDGEHRERHDHCRREAEDAGMGQRRGDATRARGDPPDDAHDDDGAAERNRGSAPRAQAIGDEELQVPAPSCVAEERVRVQRGEQRDGAAQRGHVQRPEHQEYRYGLGRPGHAPTGHQTHEQPGQGAEDGTDRRGGQRDEPDIKRDLAAMVRRNRRRDPCSGAPQRGLNLPPSGRGWPRSSP